METLIRNIQSSDLVGQLDNLRKTVGDLLHDVEVRSRTIKVDPETGIDFYEAVARFETQLIQAALEAAGGRQNLAADLLKMRKSTLNTKMKQLNLR